MKWLVGVSLTVLIVTEAILAAGPLRPYTMPVSGGVVAVVLCLLWRQMRTARESTRPNTAAPPPDELLERWLARAKARIGWADGSHENWDRYLRPLLAGDFQTSTGHRQAKDKAALAATGRMTFGPELWPWVDPNGTSYADRQDPAPGRAVLMSILERLESM